MQGELVTFIAKVSPLTIPPRGADEVEALVSAGLVTEDNQGVLRPQLAEVVPSLENGLWKLLADGRMETSWRIRTGANWHDGQPLTADDLLFTARIEQDKDLPISHSIAFDSIEAVEAPDPRTVVVKWKRPFIEADRLFKDSLMPRHLLERAYLEDRASFAQHPYWTQEFVGNGAFKPREWEQGSHLIVEAHSSYALGRPKLDEIEVRFIPDPNTLIANLLAGSVELTLGRALSLEQGIQLRDQWREGRMDVAPANAILIWPQLLGPSPQVVGDARFRRALLHATDRQQLADTLQSGLSSVFHAYVGPSDPEYPEVEREIVRYEYDPRRAGQLVEGPGYSRGTDGSFRDAAGQRLSVELRTSAGDDVRGKAVLAVADDWQRIGVGVDVVIIPTQRTRDQEYVATFPAFYMNRNPSFVTGLNRLHSSQAPLPENNFRVAGNSSRYINPQFDALIERYYVTIPRPERTQVLGQIVRHMTEQLNVMGLFYSTEPTMIGNRVKNVTARKVSATQAWNAHEWDVR